MLSSSFLIFEKTFLWLLFLNENYYIFLANNISSVLSKFCCTVSHFMNNSESSLVLPLWLAFFFLPRQNILLQYMTFLISSRELNDDFYLLIHFGIIGIFNLLMQFFISGKFCCVISLNSFLRFRLM